MTITLEARSMSPTQLQEKMTLISLEQQREPQELEVCLKDAIKEQRQRRSHRRGLDWV